MNELVEKKINELLTPTDIEMLVKFDELEKRVKVIKDGIKQELINYIKENGLENAPIEAERLVITYRHPYDRNSVDIDKLKEEGLYEMYLKKPIHVKESVSIDVRYE